MEYADVTYTLKLSGDELARYREMAAQARAAEGDAWERAGVRPGARVADIGCGPAIILSELARAVTPSGQVDGVERDHDARAQALTTLSAEGITNARIIDGLANATGLEAGSYDLVMMRHVLVHNGGSEAAIVAHLRTLLRPEGHIYLLESDLTAIRRVPDDADLQDMESRWLKLLRARGCDLTVGARLQHLLLDAGFTLDEGEAHYAVSSRRGMRPPEWAAREAMLEAGIASPADVARWQAALERMDRDPRAPLVYVPMFRAIARVRR
jgi:SAM-dependent methyltransferase